MRKLFVLGIAILISFGSFAQLEDAAKYANTISDEDLRDLLGIIASDVMEGRETGERGQKMAVKFLKVLTWS